MKKINIQFGPKEDPTIKDVQYSQLIGYLEAMLCYTKSHTMVVLFDDDNRDCLVTDNYKTVLRLCANLDESIKEIHIQMFDKSDYEDIFGYIQELWQ